MFADGAARRRLNAAIHPAVALELAARIVAAWLRCESAVVVDMPLLFESGFYRLTRPRVLVACSPATQLRRVRARDGLSAEAAAARVAAQMPLEAKHRLSDVVLENDGGVAELAAQVRTERLVNGAPSARPLCWTRPPLLLLGQRPALRLAAGGLHCLHWWWCNYKRKTPLLTRRPAANITRPRPHCMQVDALAERLRRRARLHRCLLSPPALLGVVAAAAWAWWG